MLPIRTTDALDSFLNTDLGLMLSFAMMSIPALPVIGFGRCSHRSRSPGAGSQCVASAGPAH